MLWMTKSIRKLKIDCETSADLAIKTDSSSVCLYSSVGNWFALNLLIVLGAQKEQCTNIIKRNNVLFSGISSDLEVYIKVYIILSVTFDQILILMIQTPYNPLKSNMLCQRSVTRSSPKLSNYLLT